MMVEERGSSRGVREDRGSSRGSSWGSNEDRGSSHGGKLTGGSTPRAPRLQRTTAKKDHNYCADSGEFDEESIFSMRSPGRSPMAGDSRKSSLNRQHSFRVGDTDGDIERLYKLLNIGSPAELGIGKSDWDARKLFNSRPTSPRSASQDSGQSSTDDFRFRHQPASYESSGVSPPFSPVVAPPRTIEKEWRAHRDAVKLQPVIRTNSPYKRSPPPPPPTAFPFEMGAIERSSTASPPTLIGRGSLTRSAGLDRRHSEPILDLPPSPEALLSPGDGAGKVAQFDFNNQGAVSGRKESFSGVVDDLPTAPVVPSSCRSRIFSKDSQRTKSVGSSLRWKSSKDSLEVDPCANLPEEISVGSRAVDSEDSENAEKEKVEEVSTPSSGDSSTDMLPGVFPKKPNWSTWAKGEFLGRGTFGTVYEGVGSNGMFFAVKEVSLVEEGKAGKQAIRQLEQEIALLSEIQHPNIVQYLGTERDDEKLYIFLELVSKGSLAHLYEKYEFFYDQVRLYTKQILLGLKYLHDRKIIHRDIKCANILVDASGTVKLADFGMAKQTDKLGMLKSFLGSAHWMAPEVVRGGAAGRSYNLKADIWSLGCTVLEMATGNPPYGEMESHVVLFRVGSGEAPTIPDEFDEDLKDFIRNCLEVNVANRPTCDLLLTHPFITGEPMTGPVKLVPTPELMPSIAEERSIDSSSSSTSSSLDAGASSSSLVTNMMNHGSIVRGQPKSMRKIRSEFSMSSAESITS